MCPKDTLRVDVKRMKIPLRKNPHIYEINLMTWLSMLSKREGRQISIGSIPGAEWKNLRKMGIDIVWLMGVWQRSFLSVEIARNESGLVVEGRAILADFEMEDISGSPYSVKDYRPDPVFGTTADLEDLSNRLEDEGLLLVLDFVPNHTACDHPWIRSNPEHYVRGRKIDNENCPEGLFRNRGKAGDFCIAHGKDPHFPAWTDTAQVEYRNSETRKTMAGIMAQLAGWCHGLRCDMAMLVLESVFRETWAHISCERDEGGEFWPGASETFKSVREGGILMAEAYWGKESELLDRGFDYAYDKTLYDLLVERDVRSLRGYLQGPLEYQEKMIRFLENHDEKRALTVFGQSRIRCAMVIQSTLPGMRFWQDGQFEGSQIRVPVQLKRCPEEPLDKDLENFSKMLLHEVDHPVFHDGLYDVCSTSGWEDNQSHQNLLAWTWSLGRDRRLIVSNLSDAPAQGYVKLPSSWSDWDHFHLSDPLKGDCFFRPADAIFDTGLFVDLAESDFHFFQVNKR